MKLDQKQKTLYVNCVKCNLNTHNYVKEHELIDAKKRLDAALPDNPVLKKQKKLKKWQKSLKPGDEVKVLASVKKELLLKKYLKQNGSFKLVF